MEGLSKITYKGKEIIYLDYTFTRGDKEKTISFIKAQEVEFCKHPPKSILNMTNVTEMKFDKDVMNTVKSTFDKCTPHIKKSALIGLKPIHKAAFNFLLALTVDKFTKIFDTEEEAKEWLVKD